MTITHNIKIDMAKKMVTPRVYAMQHDTNTRVVEIALYESGSEWSPPDNAKFALSYRKPDGTRGFYNKLSENVDAITVNGNKVSVILAAQVLTVAGEISSSLVMNDEQMNRLSSFPFEVHVTPDPSAGKVDSDDYFNVGGASNGMVYYNVHTDTVEGDFLYVEFTGEPDWEALEFFPEPKKGDMVISASGQLFVVAMISETGIRMMCVKDLNGKGATVEEVLEALPDAGAASFVKNGNVITAEVVMDDGSISTSVIELENGLPKKVTTDGVECPMTFEGFETEDSGGGSGDGVPFFDLAEMGLSTIPINSTASTSISIDATQIMAACGNGVVKFGCNVSMGEQELYIEPLVTSTYVDVSQTCQCNAIMTYGSEALLFSFVINPGYLGCTIKSL